MCYSMQTNSMASLENYVDKIEFAYESVSYKKRPREIPESLAWIDHNHWKCNYYWTVKVIIKSYEIDGHVFYNFEVVCESLEGKNMFYDSLEESLQEYIRTIFDPLKNEIIGLDMVTIGDKMIRKNPLTINLVKLFMSTNDLANICGFTELNEYKYNLLWSLFSFTCNDYQTNTTRNMGQVEQNHIFGPCPEPQIVSYGTHNTRERTHYGEDDENEYDYMPCVYSNKYCLCLSFRNDGDVCYYKVVIHEHDVNNTDSYEKYEIYVYYRYELLNNDDISEEDKHEKRKVIDPCYKQMTDIDMDTEIDDDGTPYRYFLHKNIVSTSIIDALMTDDNKLEEEYLNSNETTYEYRKFLLSLFVIYGE